MSFALLKPPRPLRRLGRGIRTLRPLAAPAPVNLMTNGGFDSGSSWALGNIGGPPSPTIGGGKLNLNAFSQGSNQTAMQQLAGGSSPAGTYRVNLALHVTNYDGPPGLKVQLFGADGTTLRGQSTDLTPADEGAATRDIIASGEVSYLRIYDPGGISGIDGTVDNVELYLLS